MAENMFVPEDPQCFASEEAKMLERMLPVCVHTTSSCTGVIALKRIAPGEVKVGSYNQHNKYGSSSKVVVA